MRPVEQEPRPLTPDQAVTIAINVLLYSDDPRAIEARGVLKAMRDEHRALIRPELLATTIRRCETCARWLLDRRITARFCGNGCRQKAYLRRHRADTSG